MRLLREPFFWPSRCLRPARACPTDLMQCAGRQLNRQVHVILDDQMVKKQLAEAGMDVALTTPKQFKTVIAAEL